MKNLIVLVVFAPLTLFAQAEARANFLREQAFAEMQRVTGQVDAIQTTVEELRTRVVNVERAGASEATLRAEIDSLKSAVAELRQELANQRAEIIKELSGRIAKMQPRQQPAPTTPQPPVISGPTSTYTVQSGDSLYLISKAFGTTVKRLKEMNSLKSDNLKIGQQLIVPQN